MLGCKVIAEHCRRERRSYKTDLALNGEYLIEWFSFPDSPERPTYPEARGLRHIAFEVDDLDEALIELEAKGIGHEQIRTDEYTGKRFVFFEDPDHLPIEFYES